MAQCSGKHISAMQLFYELKQRFPHIPDRLVNHCIEQARGNKEACRCMLESEKPRMSEPPVHRLEVSSAPTSPTQERPQRPPVVRTTFMPPSIRSGRTDQALQNLIQRQLERKSNLERELQKEKKRLVEMQKREQELKNELSARLAACNVSMKAKTLSEEISLLRFECSKLWNELESQNDAETEDAVDELYWRCHVCTFHNHHLLSQCESCSMPRISLEHTITTSRWSSGCPRPIFATPSIFSNLQQLADLAILTAGLLK